MSALFSRRSEGRLQQPRNHNTHRDLPPFPCDDSAGTSLLLVPPQRCHRLQHLSWPSTKHSTLEEPPPHRNLRIASGPAFIYFYLPSPFRLFAVPSLAVGSTAVGSRRHSTRAHTRASSCRLRRGARKPRHPALFGWLDGRRFPASFHTGLHPCLVLSPPARCSEAQASCALLSVHPNFNFPLVLTFLCPLRPFAVPDFSFLPSNPPRPTSTSRPNTTIPLLCS